MEYRVFRGAAVNNLRTYMSENMGRGLVISPDMFCLCAMDRGKISGVGVFEAGDVARIYEINVPAAFKNKGVEQDILLAVCGVLEDAGSKGVTMKVHETDGFAFWEPVLLRNGFRKNRTSAFYHFLLVDAYSSPIIKKASCPTAVLAMSDATAWQKTDYDQRLKERRQYAAFTDPKIAGDLSAVYIQENKIEGCFLVSEFEGLVTEEGDVENGIFVEYASTKGVRDHLALVEMIRFSMDRVWKRHVPDEHGYILSMDFTVDQIFKKIFPFGKLTGRVEEFSHAFNKKKGV